MMTIEQVKEIITKHIHFAEGNEKYNDRLYIEAKNELEKEQSRQGIIVATSRRMALQDVLDEIAEKTTQKSLYQEK